MNRKNRFSVIIATYNQKEVFLRQAINSVLAQSFDEYELIVIDDGSTDQTEKVLRSFGSRIKVVRQTNQGSELAYKAGAKHATGEYLAFLDSDDFMPSYALKIYDQIIISQNCPPLIVGAMTTFKEISEINVDPENFKHIEILNFRDYLSKTVSIGLSQSRIVVRKGLFDEAYAGGEYDNPCFLNDYNMLLQIGVFGPCVIIKSPVTVAYRQHQDQGSKNIERMSQGVFQLIRMVQRGQCSGGRSRLLAKYAFLGGIVFEWSRKAFKAHQPGLGFKILMNGWQMIVVSICRKFFLRFRPSTQPLFIEL